MVVVLVIVVCGLVCRVVVLFVDGVCSVLVFVFCIMVSVLGMVVGCGFC